MKLTEALNILSQVVETSFHGLPPEQRIVQEALQTVEKATEPVQEKKEEK